MDQQESFKLDMIDLACGVIRISIKCSCLEIFDQQGNSNLIPLVLISYHITVVNQLNRNEEMLAEPRVLEKILRSLTNNFENVVCAIEESNDLATFILDNVNFKNISCSRCRRPPFKTHTQSRY